MANKDLFKQAIADAKSIREAAIANAKLALEESLTPQLKELLAQRLAEMEEEEAPAAVISEEETTVEELVAEEAAEEAAEEVEEETLEEAAVDSAGLLAVEEAEGEEEEEGEGEEAGEEGEAEGEEAGEEAEDDSEESEDEASEEEVGEMSVDELKDLIRDVLMQVMGDQEEAQEDELEADAEDMEGEDMTATDDTISVDEEINIDELMAELAQIKDPAAAPAPTDHGNLEEAEEQIDELAEAAVNEIVAGLKGEAKEYITKMAEARGCSMQELMKEMARYGTVSEMKSVAEMLNSMSKLGEVAFMEVAGKLIAEKAAPAPAMEVAEGELNEVDPVTGTAAMLATIGAIVGYFAADQAAGKKSN